MIIRNLTTKGFLIFILFMGATGIQAQEEPYDFHAGIKQDIAKNMQGGIHSGYAQLGLINLSATLSSDQAGLWENGIWKLHLQNTYGHQPTKKLVGDVQVFSNIEHGNYTYLYQFWYKHQMENFSILAGKHDMNSIFFTSEQAGLYINSSFGIMPVASLNVPVSIFPSTTLGAVAAYHAAKGLTIRGGVYNGYPGEITQTNFGTDLNLNFSRGLFYIGELAWSHQIGNLKSTYKIGGFYHGGNFTHPGDPGHVHQGAGGLYLIADQMLTPQQSKENTQAGLFFQTGYSPDPCSMNDFYMAAGVNVFIPTEAERFNKLGLAIAHASINDQLRQHSSTDYQSCETAVELTYTHHITDQIKIQPDMQYIIHPGMRSYRDNCLVGLVRLQWAYD